MAKIKAVVFDMYETLVSNPIEGWMDVFEGVCRSQNLPIDRQTLYDEWKALEVQFRKDRLNMEDPYNSPPFKSYEEAWRDCFASVFAHRGLDGDADVAAKESIVSMGRRDAYPEVAESIAALQGRWTTAILSNADDDYLLPQLKRIGLTFPVVLSSEMIGAYKPHPLPFRRVLKALDLEPQEAVYVGDNPFDDVVGAKGVGMNAVWINRNGKTLDKAQPQPDFQVASLAQLPSILENWD